MACNCITDVNRKLADHNSQIVCTLFGQPSRCVIETTKLDPKKRGRPQAMLASFCPFCGAAYRPAPAQPPLRFQTPEDGQRPATPEDGQPVQTR